MVDGQVAAIQTGKAQRTSIEAIATEQNAQQRVPYEYALDGRSRTPIGPSDVKDDSIVCIRGTEVTVAQARDLGGFPPPISVHPLPTNGAPNQPFNEGQAAPKEEVHPDLRVDLLANAALDRDYSNLVDTTGGVEQQQALQQIVETGEIDPRTLGTIASQLGCEPTQLQERIAPLMQAFESQARKVMSEGGLNADDVIAFAQEHRPNKLQLAMNKQATARQTSGYADLRQDYLESLAEYNPQAALNADLGPGITQRQDAKGRVIVRLADGTEMEWETALRAFAPRTR